MRRNILLATLLAISAVTSSGRSILISPSPNITRNAGSTIPLTFTAAGFAGQTAQIWLVNAKTWVGQLVEIDVPVVNGVNQHPLEIPWSWEDVGPFVVKVVSGSAYATDTRVVTIRSAVIWPYAGTVYPMNGTGAISWVVGDWDLGEFMSFLLKNEDTGECYPLEFCEDPYFGRFQFYLPFGVSGNHFRIYLDAIVVYEVQQTIFDDPASGESIIDTLQSSRSAVVAIR